MLLCRNKKNVFMVTSFIIFSLYIIPFSVDQKKEEGLFHGNANLINTGMYHRQAMNT